MKRLFWLVLLMANCIFLAAQVPEFFNYQAIVRNVAGQPIVSQPVSVLFTIYKTTPAGTNVYSEKHSPITNEFGLVTLAIGGGSDKAGNFTTIDWGADNYFLNVQIDPAGGSSYTDMGTTQLLSVPYAMHSKTVASYTETDPIFGTSAASGISGTNISNWNTAHGWGNHALAGYMTSYTETDPKVGLNSENYLSKWNGTALVQTSVFDNGRIGIGTNNPGEILHIKTSDPDGNIKMEVPDGDGYYIGYNGGGDYMAFSVINGGTPFWETLNLKSGKVGIGTVNPSALLDINKPASFPSSVMNINMPDIGSAPNANAITITSSWAGDGRPRGNIFTIVDDEAAAIMRLYRLGYPHAAILSPGAFSLIGEGPNIDINWEEGFRYGGSSAGFLIQIDSDYPLYYRSYSGSWTDKVQITSQGNGIFAGTITGAGFKLPTGAVNGNILTSDASGNASWQVPVGTVPVGGVVAWLKDLAGTPSLPENFAECNGQTINDPESPFNGITLPDLNSKFLMGSASSGGSGGSPVHGHSGSMTNPSSDFPVTARTDVPMSASSPSNHTHTLNIIGASNIPPYYTVVWIIRIK